MPVKTLPMDIILNGSSETVLCPSSDARGTAGLLSWELTEPNCLVARLWECRSAGWEAGLTWDLDPDFTQGIAHVSSDLWSMKKY